MAYIDDELLNEYGQPKVDSELDAPYPDVAPEINKPKAPVTNEELGVILRQKLQDKLKNDNKQISDIQNEERSPLSQVFGGIANVAEGMQGKAITDFSNTADKAARIKNIIDARKLDDDYANMYKKLFDIEQAPKILQARINMAKQAATDRAAQHASDAAVRTTESQARLEAIKEAAANRAQNAQEKFDYKKEQDVYKKEKDLEKKAITDEKQLEMNAAQSLAAGFGKRMEQAEDVFSNLEKKGYNRADTTSGLGSMLPNMLKSSESQQQSQAERNFVNAVLRRESGAAIAPQEFTSAELQYFPRAGDSPETIQQKKNNRLQSIEALKAGAGKNYKNVKDVGFTSQPSTANTPSPTRQVRVKGKLYNVDATGNMTEA
jgi:hypothetical protein